MEPAAPAPSGRARWRIGQGWPAYLCMKPHKNVQDVNPPTQSFATSTTTAFLSLATSARPVEGTGHVAAP